MNKTTIYFFIDESGDKGYSNSKPFHEIGLMAGFLINDWDLPRLEEKMKDGLSELNLNPLKKLHMSELNSEQKSEVVNLVRRLFKDLELRFFYTVMFTESYTHFVGGEQGKSKESMHSQLLQNILMTALSFCAKIIEKYKTDVKLQIVSDNIDAGVLKIMRNDYSRIVNFFNGDVNRMYVTKKEYVESKVTNLSHDSRPKNGRFEVEIRVEDSVVTFISDVLAYTTFQHLINFMRDNKKMELNTLKSTLGHPLEEFLILQFTPDLEEINLFGELLGPGRK